MLFLIVTGMSGAGKSLAAGVLEDIGFYCVDNMPAQLIPRFSELCMAAQGRYERVAIVTDVRGGQSFSGLYAALAELKCEYSILFVEASHEAIIARYKETRRPHPLATGSKPLEQVIDEEESLLSELRSRANFIINTGGMTQAQLRRRVMSLFSHKPAGRPMSVAVTAFGYKFGLPLDADIVLDVRFLPNPHYISELRPLTGLDPQVKSFLQSYRQTMAFMKMTEDMLAFLLPEYEAEGKSALTLAIGCTGGRHRSVFVADELAGYIRRLGYEVFDTYRELRDKL